MTNEQAIDILKHTKDHIYRTFSEVDMEPSLKMAIEKGIEALKFVGRGEAAIADLEDIMFMGDTNIDTCEYCSYSACYARGGHNNCNPVWRGPQKKED